MATQFSSGGMGLRQVTTADLNADSKLDLIAINETSNTVSYLLNTTASGSVTFSVAVALTTGGTQPYYAVATDLDGNGKPDLAIANLSSNQFSVRYNTGAPTFSAPNNYDSGGIAPVALASADFDADGKADLAVANRDSGSVAVFTGAGSFFKRTPYGLAAGGAPSAVLARDLNSDGRPDLVVANKSPQANTQNSLGIIANEGSGAWSATQFVSNSSNQVAALARGDFDGDGRFDVISATTTGVHYILRSSAIASVNDVTFDRDGLVQTAFASNFSDIAQDVALQADGKVILAGSAVLSSRTAFALVRYNVDGTLDTNFSGDGRVDESIAGNAFERANGVVVQPDQKIVVVGASALSGFGNGNFALARYLSNGTLDTSFGARGRIITAFSQVSEAQAVRLQPDGKIVVVGSVGNGATVGMAIARYTTTGELDTTFGTGGKVTLAIGACFAEALAIRPDGKIVVGGSASTGKYGFAVVQLTANGSLDTSFAGDGSATIDITGSNNFLHALALQSDGKVVVGGESSDNKYGLSRLNTNGTLDTTFGASGIVTATTGSINGLAVSADGKIIAVGATDISSDPDWMVLRYNANGTLDTTFNGTGKRTFIAITRTEYATAVALQPDGDIVVGGTTVGAGSDFAIDRFVWGNLPPTALALSSLTIPENEPIARVVGTLSTVDGNAADQFSYTLVSGAGDLDNAAFTIVGNELRTNAVFDYESRSSYQIRLRSTDTFGLFVEQDLTVSVANVNETPIVRSGRIATVLNQQATVNVIATDPEGNALTYSIAQEPAHGLLSGIGPNFTYTPQAGYLGDDQFTVTASDGALTSSASTISMYTLPSRATLNIALNSTSPSEGETAVVTATLSQTCPTDVYVPLSFAGTAAATTDYLSSKVILIPAGQISGTRTISMVDDAAYEGDEQLDINVTPDSFFNLGTGSGSLTIHDNDAFPQVWIDLPGSVENQGGVAEVEQTIALTVQLSDPASTSVVIPLLYSGTATPGSDYTAPSSITIPAGAVKGVAQINLIDDLVIEKAETIGIKLGTLTGVQASTAPNRATSRTLTVKANDTPMFSLVKSADRVDESVGKYTVEARLAQPATTALAIPFTLGGTATAGDYTTQTPLQFSFAAGATSAFFDITVTDDTVKNEPTETVEINVTAGSSFDFDGNRKFALAINDNDLLVIDWIDTSVDVWEDQGVLAIRAKLSSPNDTGATLQIPVQISSGRSEKIRQKSGGHYEYISNGFTSTRLFVDDYIEIEKNPSGMAEKGTDFTVSSAILSFAPLASVAQLSLTITNDIDREQAEFIDLTIDRSLTNVRPGVKTTARVKLRDDDADVGVDGPGSMQESEGASEFTILLTKPVNHDVTVSYTFSGSAALGNDYTAAATRSVTIPEGATSAVVPVNVVNDTVFERDETCILQITSVTGALLGNFLKSDFTIVDNEGPPSVLLSHRAFAGFAKNLNRTPLYREQFIESDQTFSLAEKDGKKTVRVKLNGATSQTAYVNVAIVGASEAFRIEGLNDFGQLEIPIGRDYADLVVSTIDNQRVDGAHAITIQFSSARNAKLPVPTPKISFATIDDEKSGSTASNVAAAINGQLQISDQATGSSISPAPGSIPAALNSAAGVTILPGTLAIGTYTGTGSHGLLDHSIVFFDSNFSGSLDWYDFNSNGVKDIGDLDEASTSTDSDGSFFFDFTEDRDLNGNGVIDPNDGRFVLGGGTDSSTGFAWRTTLRAPVGMYGITPLTTLAESVVRVSGLSAQDAADRLIAALEIDGYSLLNSNPLYEIDAGSGSSARAYQATVKLYATVIQLSEFVNGTLGSNVSVDEIASELFDAAARRISASGAILDLTNVGTISSLLGGLMDRFGTQSTAAAISAAESIVAAHVGLVNALALSDYALSGDYITAIVKIKKQAYGDSADAMRQLGAGSLTPAAALSGYTGAALSAKIAAQSGALAIPAVISVGSGVVSEGNTGQRTITFPVEVTGDHTGTITVNWRTADGSASVADGDYVAASGSFTWAGGDGMARSVVVTVNGDSVFEPDEFLKLELLDAVGGVIKTPEVAGLILNDDGFVLTADPTSTANDFQTYHTRSRHETHLNGTLAVSGYFAQPVVGIVQGTNSAADSYTVDLSSETYRGDSTTFNAGDGPAVDSLNVIAGRFSRIEQQWTSSDDGTTALYPINDATISLAWNGVEASSLLVSEVDTLVLRLPANVLSAIVEDADFGSSGTMRLRSNTGEFAPVVFANPMSQLLILFENNAASLQVASTDSTFTGTVQSGAAVVLLSANSILEGSAGGSNVGVFSSLEPMFADGFNVSLVAGAGDDDNAFFSINGSTLKLLPSPDYEAKPSYTVRVRAVANDGSLLERSLTILVTNVDATLSGLVATATGREDTNVAIIDPAVSDPGSGTIYVELEALHGTVSVSNVSGVTLGGNNTLLLLSGSPANLNTALDSLQFRADTNSNSVSRPEDYFRVIVRTGDTASSMDMSATVSIQIDAVNDAPTFLVGPSQTLSFNAGSQTVLAWATAISAGPSDESGQGVSFIVTGNSNLSLFAVAPSVDSSGKLTFTPATGVSGIATIRIIAVDNGGVAAGGIDSSAEQIFQITVSPPSTQHIESFSATTTGARFTLSQSAVVTSGLNLYDYRDPSGVFLLGASDVQLTNGAGQEIPGSLVIDATGTRFSFVATAGRLPAGNYSLTLRSAADGFRTTGGALLDGNGDGTTGDNFTTTFTVAAPPTNAVTVSLPHFARGPEQAVNVPTTSALGLPIKVSDGANLTAMQFDLAYDVGLLSMTNVTQVGGGTATLTPLSAGRTRVALTFSIPLTAGPQTVAYLTAAVPSAAANRYGERGLLDISNIVLTAQGGGSVPGIDQDAVQINTYFGDVGRNGRYDSFDVQQTSRLALDLDTGFQQHPLADPILLADFNDNGRIDSFDTQRVSRLALNLPVTEAADLPNPLPTVTDTDRVVAEQPPKSPPAAPTQRSDIDGNGSVDAQDVLWAVYYFGESSNGTPPSDIELKRVDVNSDGLFDAADILLTINDLDPSAAQAEGESSADLPEAEVAEEDLEGLAYLLAVDSVVSKKKLLV